MLNEPFYQTSDVKANVRVSLFRECGLYNFCILQFIKMFLSSTLATVFVNVPFVFEKKACSLLCLGA